MTDSPASQPDPTGAPPAGPAGTPFDRLRDLALRIPEGASELLPIIDFLETFPEQVTEQALVHLVGVTALGMARAGQGGIWDGERWIFLRGSAPAFPTNPGRGWTSLPWLHRLRQPTLVMAGDDDPLIPLINARLLHRLIPRSELKVFDCGHLFLMTRPEESAAAIAEFLDRR